MSIQKIGVGGPPGTRRLAEIDRSLSRQAVDDGAQIARLQQTVCKRSLNRRQAQNHSYYRGERPVAVQHLVTPFSGISTRMARSASLSNIASAAAAFSFQARAACNFVKGRIGNCATRSASFSLNSIFRMAKSSSDGGAPWGKRFSRSESLE